MRTKTILRKLLRIEGAILEGATFTEERKLVVDVRVRSRPRCERCGRRAPRYDRRVVHWRHFSFGRVRVYLRSKIARVQCSCGVCYQQVPWAESSSRFTSAFEELVAYVAQVTDQTHVARLLGLSWRTVGRIIQRVVERRLDASRFHGLRRIGIDEFSYRKRHRYLTVVVDHDRKRVVWAGPGRSAEALAGFFSQLDQNTKDSISTVTMDMAGGYIKAVAEHLPNASIVFDRFHVQRLVADAIDGIRRECVTSLRGTGRESWVKGMRFILLRHGSELNLDDIDRIAHLGKTSKALQRAWLRKEELVAIFDETDPVLARTLLKRWLAWASRSRIPSFVRIGRTLRRHWNGIIAYFDERLTNGLVEGFNNKIRVVARTAYGFHSPDALIARIFLVVGGLSLQPELP